MEFNNLEIKRYHFFSIAFFTIFLIGLFFPWFSDVGIKAIQGTLILSSLFPGGIIAILIFFGINFIAILRKSDAFLHILNTLPLIALAMLAIRLIMKYDELPLGFGFYISIISLALSFVFCVANVLCFEKKSNAPIPLD